MEFLYQCCPVIKNLFSETYFKRGLLLNPTLGKNFCEFLLTKVETQVLSAITMGHETFLQPHIWISSSGSSAQSERQIKLMALSQNALMASAKAVNQHLAVTTNDRWLNVLPMFHVGGLGIFFRAHLSSSTVINLYSPSYKWNPVEFWQNLQANAITLTSLVPTQIYDLVAANLKAPTHLRAIIVGGAHLPEDLYIRARALGWPLLTSFGMTELCSQIATAELTSLNELSPQGLPALQLLNHIEARINQDAILELCSPALMSGYLQVQGDKVLFHECQKNHWYQSQDRAQITGKFLKVFGRRDDVIKILGENVNLAFLRERIYQFFNLDQVYLMARPHDRKGHELVLIIDKSSLAENTKVQEQLSKYNQSVLPFERVEQTIEVASLPRSPLGKILPAQILT